MTGWSWKLGRVAGIDVYMHGTFLILLAWVGVSHYVQRHHLADAGAGIVFILVLFAIIVLHELGHALTARHYGIRTRDITLRPIGGVGAAGADAR
jgi:Zn-dependent protease